MRTSKKWVSAGALALITTFWAAPSRAAAKPLETAVALRPLSQDATVGRTQVVLGGTIAALAAVLLLRRNSIEND